MDGYGFIEFVARGPFGIALAAAWGAIWGSFFNVVIVRLPADESLVRPASCCRTCCSPIRWYDNVPVLSYLLLRGRCRRCGARYSPRYLLVELAVAALAVAVHQVYLDVPGATPLALAQFLIGSLFCGLLVAVAVIDLDTMLIPNAITYPGIPVAMALSAFMELPRWWDGPAGGVAGYLLIRLFADGYYLLTGRQGMGYGDAKLLALVGGLLGWQVLLPVLFLSSMQGSVIGITLLAIFRRRGAAAGAPPPEAAGSSAPLDAGAAPEGVDEAAAGAGSEDGEWADVQPGAQVPLRYARMPFGPFIALAAVEVLLFRRSIMAFFPYLER